MILVIVIAIILLGVILAFKIIIILTIIMKNLNMKLSISWDLSRLIKKNILNNYMKRKKKEL
jgi:hypothetical protein